jgi:nucleoside-diphosphate-sugar epimerase
LSTRSVAVTGATGFVGGHIVRHLSAQGYKVRALTRRRGAVPTAAGVTPVSGALDDPASLDELVAGADAVIHCAGLIRGASAAAFDAVNVAGTARVADAAARSARPPRLVFVSSLAAREPALSPYASSKRRAEAELSRHGGALRWAALRPAAVYGPGDRATLVLFRNLRRGIAPVPRVAGARLSMIYVEDLAAAAVAAIGDTMPTGSIFEIHDGAEAGYSWRLITEHAARILEADVRRLRIPRTVMQAAAVANTAHGMVTGRAPMITLGKVRELYHADWFCPDNPLTRYSEWRPTILLDDGFRRTLDWYRSAGWL